jgi:phosphoribosylanthranilate isomerase
MTHVKICGLTREQDVRLAVECGAWACGFVLTASPRRLMPEQAARLVDAAGDTTTVGVVTTESPEWIAAALAVAGLTAVQLSAGADGPTVADTPDARDADLVLLDVRAPGVYGGSGATLDWRALAADRPLRAGGLVLAGGLTCANVAEAIAALRPLAVDVSSGVEQAGAPGPKNAAQLKAFFAAVRQADAGAGTPARAATSEVAS